MKKTSTTTATKVVVSYHARIANRFSPAFWVRDENVPNLRVHATRFDSMENAKAAAAIVRENLREVSSMNAARFVFSLVEAV